MTVVKLGTSAPTSEIRRSGVNQGDESRPLAKDLKSPKSRHGAETARSNLGFTWSLLKVKRQLSGVPGGGTSTLVEE